MISYAQNGEDVVLARAFADCAGGFYVDVGAWHPTEHSVTKHFYDLGWHGINIEPTPEAHRLFTGERPRDVNLALAVGLQDTEQVLFSFPQTGLSTLSAEVASAHAGRVPIEMRVRVQPLRQILAEHAPGQRIDFLKVDVEGSEQAVLESLDFAHARPRVIVVEAISPGTRRPSHAAWEPLLLAAGYAFALFDGLNRFYARDDEPLLLRRLSYPACCTDGFSTIAEVVMRRDFSERLLAAQTQVNALSSELDALKERLFTEQIKALATQR